MPGISHRSHPQRIPRFSKVFQWLFSLIHLFSGLEFALASAELSPAFLVNWIMQGGEKAPVLIEQNNFQYVLPISVCIASAVNGITKMYSQAG